MKATGRINPLNGEEIMQAEESDITFWGTNWDDLSDEQKVMFLSFMNIQFLGKQNYAYVKGWYEYYQLKNTMDL